MAEINSIGVVGAGQMGSGIAQLAVVNSVDVWLHDTDAEALTRAQNSISNNIQRQLSKGHLSQAVADDALRRIKFTSNLEDFGSVDFVVEAIVESEDVKKKLFIQLDNIVKGSTILASNTSSISITRLASATKQPSQVIGMHFMNPPPIMKLVEIIRGADTSDDTYHATRCLAESNEFLRTWLLSGKAKIWEQDLQIGVGVLTHRDGFATKTIIYEIIRFGKTVICSNDYSGFIVNRILMPMINEAFYTLYTGVATKEDIDTGMKLGTNHPMGPLELADFIGLDVCLSIMKVLHTGLGDSKYAPCPLLVQYVDAGRLGKKRGIGVYTYNREQKETKSSPRL